MFTQEQLTTAFNRVSNKTNWKLPIKCTVEFNGDEDMKLLSCAIVHFTGSVPSFNIYQLKSGKKKVKINAVGYYNSIGA